MSTNDVQTIVVGAGAIGSAAAHWLAERGQSDVLVLEQWELGHGNGGSEDHSRIIRHSYHNSTYGQLTQAAYDNWALLEEKSGQQLVVRTGGLDIAELGTPGVESVEGYRRTLRAHGHAFDVLDGGALVDRFPQWALENPITATYQADSGILDIRRARQTHVARAAGAGDPFRERTAARRLESIDGGVRVHTDAGSHTADHVIVATASWTDDLLRDLGQTWRTTISQEQVCYFATPAIKDFSVGRFPLWVWHGDVMYYGFPVYGEVAIKVSRDVTGNFVTQQTRSHEPSPAETEFLLDFVRTHLPAGVGRELYSKTCVYDMPPDRNFIIDALPGHPRIIVGNGAGHAAKFSGWFGDVLSELVVEGRTSQPIQAFKADRPELTDPDFAPVFALKG